jgi:hypothetical protein
VTGSCEHSNEPTGSIRSGKFLDSWSDYEDIRKAFAP